MFSIATVTFLVPWVFIGLISLPLLWWLMRFTPPLAKKIFFPSLKLLNDIKTLDQTPKHTPFWLLILRMLIVLLLIFAFAHPILKKPLSLSGSKLVIMIVDNDWAAANFWQEMNNIFDKLFDQLEIEDKKIIVIPTISTSQSNNTSMQFLNIPDARSFIKRLQPYPWTQNHQKTIEILEILKNTFEQNQPEILWFSNGLVSEDKKDDEVFIQYLKTFSKVKILYPQLYQLPLLIHEPEIQTNGIKLNIERISAGSVQTITVKGRDQSNQIIFDEQFSWDKDKKNSEKIINIPTELRNRLRIISIDNYMTATSIYLLDNRWIHHPVGIIAGGLKKEDQPFLSENFYLERALNPFSEIRYGNSLSELLNRPLAVLIMADVGGLEEKDLLAVSNWIDKGGIVIRFAGPHLASHPDRLLPVQLRSGDRTLGGSMSWSQPLRLLNFSDNSPFIGLSIPNDILVNRQVLAEPDLDINKKTWARLEDGTPLVTAIQQNKGWIVLIHTTANNDWSNLPLSGLFVDMLRKLISLSQGTEDHNQSINSLFLPPIRILDGFGKFQSPPSSVSALKQEEFAQQIVNADHPPGLYGYEEGTFYALNLISSLKTLQPIDFSSFNIDHEFLITQKDNVFDFKPWLLSFAFILLIIDMLISLWVRGLNLKFKILNLTIFLIFFMNNVPIFAQTVSSKTDLNSSSLQQQIDYTKQTRLAYVMTGSDDIDHTSKLGLTTLSWIVNQRTSAEIGDPIGINIEKDELSFFPLLYWPISSRQIYLSSETKIKLNYYLRNGGMIFFDTQDQSNSANEQLDQVGQNEQRLQELSKGLDIPLLIRLNKDHVLSKSFYILQNYPGRWYGGDVWVEQTDQTIENDGVSAVIIGSNDWAGAWAFDPEGIPLYPVVPYGERQRELAFRFGINLVIYALTGNYKSDQVHVQSILERLVK
ncbi:MAG: DUF4159 domain-containing protein [Alphaproteobacteria bacterium]|nr:DUF4159 domain-containing protein [Alphaproteobacteria bacterium]